MNVPWGRVLRSGARYVKVYIIQESSYGHVTPLKFWVDRCCGDILFIWCHLLCLNAHNLATLFSGLSECLTVCSRRGNGHFQDYIIGNCCFHFSHELHSLGDVSCHFWIAHNNFQGRSPFKRIANYRPVRVNKGGPPSYHMSRSGNS